MNATLAGAAPLAVLDAALRDAPGHQPSKLTVCVGDAVDSDSQDNLLRCADSSSGSREEVCLHASLQFTTNRVRPLPTRLVFRGHGTRGLGELLVATACGVVERVNKLVTVRTLQNRYSPEVGDVIVGRVTEVGNGRAAASRL